MEKTVKCRVISQGKAQADGRHIACGEALISQKPIGFTQIFAMDTVMEISAYGSQAEDAVNEAESRIQGLEKALSRTLPDSDVSRINRNDTTPTANLTSGTQALLEAALDAWALWKMVNRGKASATSEAMEKGGER